MQYCGKFNYGQCRYFFFEKAMILKCIKIIPFNNYYSRIGFHRN